mgnify:FL=1
MIFDSIPATVLIWAAVPVLVVGSILITATNRRGRGQKAQQRAFLWFPAGAVLLLLGIAVGNLPGSPFGFAAFTFAAVVCAAVVVLSARNARSRATDNDPKQ